MRRFALGLVLGALAATAAGVEVTRGVGSWECRDENRTFDVVTLEGTWRRWYAELVWGRRP